MKKLIISAAMLVMLIGCSNTNGLEAVSGTDKYSVTRNVIGAPQGTDCQTSQCIMLSAFWTESHKNMVLLTISLANTGDFIRSAYLEIDGKKVQLRYGGFMTRYDSNVTTTEVYVKSSKDFLVPLGVVKDITKAKKAWVFVQTGSGPMSNAIIDAQGGSKAYYALQRFLAALPK